MLHVAWQCDSLTSDGNFAYGTIHKWRHTIFQFFTLPPSSHDPYYYLKIKKERFAVPSFHFLDYVIYG